MAPTPKRPVRSNNADDGSGVTSGVTKRVPEVNASNGLQRLLAAEVTQIPERLVFPLKLVRSGPPLCRDVFENNNSIRMSQFVSLQKVNTVVLGKDGNATPEAPAALETIFPTGVTNNQVPIT